MEAGNDGEGVCLLVLPADQGGIELTVWRGEDEELPLDEWELTMDREQAVALITRLWELGLRPTVEKNPAPLPPLRDETVYPRSARMISAGGSPE
ncbi:MAG: hypothetical protein HQL51_01710 [Magnetococcales bacterium]|nr:hypothetical protein [Magnetococcales bacterium]